MAEPKAPTPRYHIPRAHGDAHAAHTQAQATSAPLAHGGAAAASIAAAPSTLQEPKHAPILAVHEATARYGRRVALNRVSLHIDAGDILVLLGPNGAGKSTLVKSIAGRLKLQAGSVHVVGRNPRTDKRARQASGFVPQQLALFDKLTAIENLKAFGRLMGLKGRDIHERALQTLEYVGLADRAHEQVGALSGGMKRRINIGAALMHQPQLVVLDEPTVGVDMKARRAIAALLRRLSARGIAILLTTHDMEEAEALADQVAILVGGEIKAHGKRAHLIEDRFGAHQLVTLTLAGPREERLKSWLGVRFERALRDFGLRPHDTLDQWSGFIDGRSSHIQQLLASIPGADVLIEELRVRRPGLDTLLASYTGSLGQRRRKEDQTPGDHATGQASDAATLPQPAAMETSLRRPELPPESTWGLQHDTARASTTAHNPTGEIADLSQAPPLRRSSGGAT